LSHRLQIATSLQHQKQHAQGHEQASLKSKLKQLGLHHLISLEELRHNILCHLLQLCGHIVVDCTVCTVGISHG